MLISFFPCASPFPFLPETTGRRLRPLARLLPNAHRTKGHRTARDAPGESAELIGPGPLHGPTPGAENYFLEAVPLRRAFHFTLAQLQQQLRDANLHRTNVLARTAERRRE